MADSPDQNESGSMHKRYLNYREQERHWKRIIPAIIGILVPLYIAECVIRIYSPRIGSDVSPIA